VEALTGHGDVRLAAAEALGRIGTAAAVLPLREAASAHPGDGVLRQVVRESVAAIRARLTGASPGQLALAEGASGHVSLAEDPRGRVTVPDEPGDGSD
jgi:HEAT repeat protein